jgi:hypothetical protein
MNADMDTQKKMARKTTTEELARLMYVQEWNEDMQRRLLAKCEGEGFSDEQTLAFAQRVADNENLSALRGGDAMLDRFVADAFDYKSV